MVYVKLMFNYTMLYINQWHGVTVRVYGYLWHRVGGVGCGAWRTVGRRLGRAWGVVQARCGVCGRHGAMGGLGCCMPFKRGFKRGFTYSLILQRVMWGIICMYTYNIKCVGCVYIKHGATYKVL